MGEHAVNTPEPGRTVLSLGGEFSLADASGLKQAMLGALASCGPSLSLDLAGVTGADPTFIQLLFALSAQAERCGKRIVMASPLPAPLRRAAEDLGIAQRDFQQAFSFEDNT